MSSDPPHDPTPQPNEPAPDEQRGPAELVALGIGCLVTVLFFGAVLLAALMSNG